MIITIGHLEWIRGKLVGVRVVVTEIGWDGNMRRWVPGTAGLTGADRWDNIMEQILPPPPHRAAAGSSAYVPHHRGQPDQIPVRSRRRTHAGAVIGAPPQAPRGTPSF